MVVRAGTEQDICSSAGLCIPGSSSVNTLAACRGSSNLQMLKRRKSKRDSWQESETRWQLFFQCVVQPKAGGHCRKTGHWWAVLCWLWREKRVNQKQSKQEHSKSQQERAMETGGKKKRHLNYWSVPCRQTAFFQAEKLKSCIARACAFLPLLVIPFSVVTCTFWELHWSGKCNSGMSGTHMLMCQWEPSSLLHNDWSDFCSAFGKCRLRRSHKEHHELIETTFLSLCKERLLPSLLPVSLASPLLPQHHPLPISNSSGRYRC